MFDFANNVVVTLKNNTSVSIRDRLAKTGEMIAPTSDWSAQTLLCKTSAVKVWLQTFLFAIVLYCNKPEKHWTVFTYNIYNVFVSIQLATDYL